MGAHRRRESETPRGLRTSRRDELAAQVAEVEGLGDAAPARERLMLPSTKEILAEWQDLVDRIERYGPDGTPFDFVTPMIQQPGDTLPDGPGYFLPRPKPGEGARGTGSVEGRSPCRCQGRSRGRGS